MSYIVERIPKVSVEDFYQMVNRGIVWNMLEDIVRTLNENESIEIGVEEIIKKTGAQSHIVDWCLENPPTWFRPDRMRKGISIERKKEKIKLISLPYAHYD